MSENHISVEIIRSEHIKLWSSMWNETQKKSSNEMIRGIGEDYFERKYIGHKEITGYTVYSEKKEIIGFFGVRSVLRDGREAAEFVDFIISEEFQMKGYLSKIIQLLKNEIFEDKSSFIFYPVNRQAMIAWKFSLKPDSVEEMNYWAVPLKHMPTLKSMLAAGDELVLENKWTLENESIMEDKRLLKEENLSVTSHINLICMTKEEAAEYFYTDFLHWRFLENTDEHRHYRFTSDKETRGIAVIRDIPWKDKKGAEVCALELFHSFHKEAAEILDRFIDFIISKGYEFLLIKTYKLTIYDQYFEQLRNDRKLKKKQYKFMIFLKDAENIQAASETEQGEILDIPRDNQIIKEMYRSL